MPNENYSFEDALRDVASGNIVTAQDLLDLGMSTDAVEEFEQNLDSYLQNWSRQSLELLRQEEQGTAGKRAPV